MRILITGGAGFIGSHFVKKLLSDKNNKIIVVDKLTYAGDEDNLKEVWNDIFFYENDIVSTMVGYILQNHKPDIIVNFAAETHVDNSIKNPRAFLNTDILGLFNLVYYSMKHKVKKFIHISTDEVYGPIPDNWNEATETDMLNPTSPYSASKASADLLLLSYFKTYGFPVTIVRPCNNYGPNQYIEKLIPLSVMRLLKNKKVLIHGQGKEQREWIYVEDCVDAINRIMLEGKIGEIYNVGSGFRISNLTVIDYILNVLRKDQSLKDNVEFVNNRPGNDSRYAIDSDKIHENLYFLDKDETYLNTDFKNGIEKTIKWYIFNMKRYRKLDLDLNIYKDNEDYLR